MKPFEPYLFKGNIKDFVSPPMDALSPSEMSGLLEREYNIVQVILGKSGNRKERLNEWEKIGALSSTGKKAFIILEQHFKHLGKHYSRIGVIGNLDINIKKDLIPHERTIRKLVEERKQVFKEIEAQVEPILVTVSGGNLEYVLKKIVSKRTKTFFFSDSSKTLNDIYIIEDRRSKKAISESLRDENGIIADGHHRFQALKEINQERTSAGLSKFPCYVYVTSLQSNSLQIAGFNRIINGKKDDNFWKVMKNYFSIREVRRFQSKEKIVLYDGIVRELDPLISAHELVKNNGIDPGLFTDFSDAVILPRLLSEEKIEGKDSIKFIASYKEAMEEVDLGKASLAILIPPWKKDTFLRIIESGRLLNPKSTFFFPKIYAGIAVFRME